VFQGSIAMVETRKLAAILAADIAGFSRLTGADEDRTLARIRTLRSGLIEPTVVAHNGRLVKWTGDGALVEFKSVVHAVRCAVEIQNAMIDRNADQLLDDRIEFRIGIHLGDVVEERDGDLMGDGVNIAARLEGIIEPGAICLSEDAYRQVRSRLDCKVADLGEIQLKNIAEPIRAYAIYVGEIAEPRSASSGTSKAPAFSVEPDEPSIAVLPFANMSGDQEQEFFCDGLVEDIITTLSKISGLRVIARNSSFIYRGRSIDVRQIARELGSRFILEGSVRKHGDRVRITTQLIDAAHGAQVWAERYDRVIDDIFGVQDEITLILATEMQVKLTEGEQARLRYTTTNNIEAWTAWVEGLTHYRKPPTKESMGRALHCWERALRLDPSSAVLNAMLGFIQCLDARFGWWTEREAALAKAQAYVDTALHLDPECPDAHRTRCTLLFFQRRFEEAATAARRSTELAPNSADVAEIASFVLAPSGYPDEAVDQIEKAMKLSPNYPPYYLGILGNAYHLAGRVDEAISAFKAYDDRSSGFGLVDLVIIYQQHGRTEDAKEAAGRLMKARRGFTISSWLDTQFRRDQTQLEQDVASLREAGLPFA
jgi:adenylate cyclase